MGRHSASYIAAQQRLSTRATGADPATYVGRIGLLAVALGIGAAVASGTATANADTATGNDTDHHSARPSSSSPAASPARKPRVRTTAIRTVAEHQPATEGAAATEGPAATGGPASLPRSIFRGPRKTAVTPERDASTEVSEPATSQRTVRVARQTPPAPEPTAQETSAPGGSPGGQIPESLDVLQLVGRKVESVLSHGSPASVTTTAAASTAPSPGDQVRTEYGDIGKWMLEPNGQISDYGGQLDDGKTLLEPVNVIIVDPTSRTAWIASWKLNATMRKAGFPAQAFHSGGFRGIINDRTYRQQPTGFRGFSNNFFLLTNDHGRVFGPAPVKTSSGYVWSGAFSTEEWGSYNGRPAHLYVSSNDSRDALATALLASGQARDGGLIFLDNAYNTDTTTTGDHDGNAVVLVLE